MADYTTSVDMQDRLLERPLNETSPATTRSIPISTRYGYVLVTQQGPPDREVIVTYHDVGYNCMYIIDFNVRIIISFSSRNTVSSFFCFY